MNDNNSENTETTNSKVSIQFVDIDKLSLPILYECRPKVDGKELLQLQLAAYLSGLHEIDAIRLFLRQNFIGEFQCDLEGKFLLRKFKKLMHEGEVTIFKNDKWYVFWEQTSYSSILKEMYEPGATKGTYDNPYRTFQPYWQMGNNIDVQVFKTPQIKHLQKTLESFEDEVVQTLGNNRDVWERYFEKHNLFRRILNEAFFNHGFLHGHIEGQRHFFKTIVNEN